MTPEEKIVINRAIYLRLCLNAGDPPRLGRLLDAVDALIFSCSKCNYEGHTCPGCGTNVAHTETACSNCDVPPPLNVTNEESLSDPWLTPADNFLDWYTFIYADVRRGDTIRHTKTAPPAKVLTCSIEDRHVKDGGTGKHWDDDPVEHQLTRVRLDYPGSDPRKILDIPSHLPVDILLSAEEARIVRERHATSLDRLATREEEQIMEDDRTPW